MTEEAYSTLSNSTKANNIMFLSDQYEDGDVLLENMCEKCLLICASFLLIMLYFY